MSTATLPKPAELRSQLEGLGDKLNGLRSKDRDDANREELRSTIEEISYLDSQLTIALRSAEVEALEQQFNESGGPKGGTRNAQGVDTRSAGEMFVEADGYEEWAKRGSSGTFETELRTLVDSTGLWAATHTDGPGLLRPNANPTMPAQSVIRRRLWLEQLITSVNTNLSSVPYIMEKNAEANAEGAAFVAEGGQKPEVAIDFTAADAPIRKVAAWIPATYEILQDAPTLRGYIDERLRYMIQVRREAAILNGDGTAPNLRGLLATPGRQAQAFDTDVMVTLGRAIGKMEVADGSADFVVMHPSDFWAAATTRYGDAFDADSAPFGSPTQQVWGVNVVRTKGITVGTALVGDRTAAVILNREGTVVRAGDQHLDYFTTNKVAILAEARLGLAVHRPDWLVDVDLTAL